jgi:hypothetical protein
MVPCAQMGRFCARETEGCRRAWERALGLRDTDRMPAGLRLRGVEFPASGHEKIQVCGQLAPGWWPSFSWPLATGSNCEQDAFSVKGTLGAESAHEYRRFQGCSSVLIMPAPLHAGGFLEALLLTRRGLIMNHGRLRE